jgi:RNA polymerase sigma factor (sigma-70 family)
VGSERDLVASAIRGDPQAFAALVSANRSRIEAVVGRMLPGEEAEDVLQEALLRAYLGLSRLRDPERFGSWLCGIALNLAKMRLRRRVAQPQLVAAGGLGFEAVDTQDHELLRIVRDAVELLPPGQRDVVLMHYVDDLSCEEIARLLGTSPGAVRVRLHRARAQLRRELAPLAPAAATAITREKPMIEMKLDDVVVRVSPDDPFKPVSDSRVVLLKEGKGDRRLAIWTGAAEGNTLASKLVGWDPPRPMTSDLIVELLRVLGARVERVAVTELRETTFYATISVAVDGNVEELDARPSDALNLAVRVGAPILVDEAVLEQQGMAEGDLESGLQRMCERNNVGVPSGEWRSLSAELLRDLHAPPGGGRTSR